jgi:hypothetical protein
MPRTFQIDSTCVIQYVNLSYLENNDDFVSTDLEDIATSAYGALLTEVGEHVYGSHWDLPYAMGKLLNRHSMLHSRGPGMVSYSWYYR